MLDTELVMDHLARHRFTTLAALHQMFLHSANFAEAKNIIRGRMRDGLLPLECRFIAPKIPVLQAQGRGKIGLVTAWSRWALLHYCCLQDEKRVRLLPNEFLEFLRLPAISGLDLNTQFFCIGAVDRTITQVIADFRPSATIQSPVKRSIGHDMARRICERWQRFQSIPALSEMHGAGLLSVTALVASESKKALVLQTLRQEMRVRPALLPGKVKVHVVPELLTLIQ